MYKRMHTSEHVHVRVTLDVIPRQTPTSFRETGFSLGPGAHPWVKLVLTKGPQYTSSALGLQADTIHLSGFYYKGAGAQTRVLVRSKLTLH